MCTTNFHVNYDFILSKSIKIIFNTYIFIHILYTSIELTCGTLIIKIKISICACSIVSRVFIYESNKPLCGIVIINLGKNSICACYCKRIKTSFAGIKQEYKICISNLNNVLANICNCMNNYIYLLRQQR